MRVPAIIVPLFLSFSLSLFAQSSGPPASGPPAYRPDTSTGPIVPAVPADSPLFADTGDAAIARRYVEWAQKELAAGRSAEALAALERGADYGGASSDLSYLLAVFRLNAGLSRYSVLEACRRALETRRWERYGPEAARLLEARIFTGLRRFEEALNVLDRCDPERYETRYRRLLALRGLAEYNGGDQVFDFVAALRSALDRFPRETGPVRILFEYALPRDAWLTESDIIDEGAVTWLRPLIDLALRRLPVLIDSDPELSYLAAPFIRNKEEARRYTQAYRAVRHPNPASLPAALNLGLINGTQAVEELFTRYPANAAELVLDRDLILDRKLIIEVNNLLRSEEERTYLRRNLLRFTGVVIEDMDDDGIAWMRTRYSNGMIQEYRRDDDADGEAELIVSFAQGLPAQAEMILVESENSENGDAVQVFPLNWDKPRKVLLRWERYPAVLNAELEGKLYIPKPLDYYFNTFSLQPLVFGGPDYPVRLMYPPFLTERSLLSFANILSQPSAEFSGGTERIELENGIPVKSTVYVNDKIAAQTEYSRGQPVVQYADLDLDGRKETIRRYDSQGLASSESDWDGDGIYEYAEIRQSDGSVKKYWDFNRDGIRESEQ